MFECAGQVQRWRRDEFYQTPRRPIVERSPRWAGIPALANPGIFPLNRMARPRSPLCRKRHSVLCFTRWRPDPNRLIWSDSDHLAWLGETTPSY